MSDDNVVCPKCGEKTMFYAGPSWIRWFDPPKRIQLYVCESCGHKASAKELGIKR